jgi:serpin B
MKRLLIATVGLTLFAAGCHHADPSALTLKPGPVQAWANKQPAQTSAQMHAGQDFALISNAVAFKLFAAVDKPGENVFISPLSVTMALSMLANGAHGHTQDVILNALSDKGGVVPMNDGAKNLMTVLHSGHDCPITLSNAVWTVGKNVPNPSFVSALSDNYAAKVGSGLPTGPAGADVINKWTSDATSGLIDHVRDTVKGDAHVILANAAVFAAPWQSQFDPKNTSKGVFKKSNGAQAQANYMTQDGGEFDFSEDDDATCVAMPYKASDFEMVMVLPAKTSPEEFLKKQTWETWSSLLGGLYKGNTSLKIPKMTYRAQYDLLPSMRALGLGELLDHADMSGISAQLSGEVVSEAFQDTFLQVEEQGTQAAATTELSTAGGAGGGFSADRPFAFAIVHKPTGAILFLGVCNDPSQLQ